MTTASKTEKNAKVERKRYSGLIPIFLQNLVRPRPSVFVFFLFVVVDVVVVAVGSVPASVSRRRPPAVLFRRKPVTLESWSNEVLVAAQSDNRTQPWKLYLQTKGQGGGGDGGERTCVSA